MAMKDGLRWIQTIFFQNYWIKYELNYWSSSAGVDGIGLKKSAVELVRVVG